MMFLWFSFLHLFGPNFLNFFSFKILLSLLCWLLGLPHGAGLDTLAVGQIRLHEGSWAARLVWNPKRAPRLSFRRSAGSAAIARVGLSYSEVVNVEWLRTGGPLGAVEWNLRPCCEDFTDTRVN